MAFLNNLWDSGPSGRNTIIAASGTLMLCGCLLIGFAGFSVLRGGALAGAPEPTPTGAATPTLPASTPLLAATLPAQTPTLPATPTVDPALPTGTPDFEADKVTPGADCDCAAERTRCQQFASAAEAQICLDKCTALGVTEGLRLDKNENGIACDEPTSTPSSP